MKHANRIGMVALAAAIVATVAPTARAADVVSLAESGSTLMYPLLEQWTSQYRSAAGNVRIPITATNSGEGIAQAIAGRVQFGASDAYMTDEQMSANPGILNIPLVIWAQLVAYNIPGLNDASLRLDGPTLAGILVARSLAGMTERSSR